MTATRWTAALLLLSLLANAAAAQAILRVGPGFFPDIQAAVDAASANDVVLVDAGVYPSFDVGKPLVVTAQPSALVQIVSTRELTFRLLPSDRLHLAGLDMQVGAVMVEGGLVSMERCTVRADRGMHLTNTIATLRWSSVGARYGSGIVAVDTELHASDSTFSTAAAGALTIEHGAVKLLGASNCQLALCTLIGAWPVSVRTPWPSVALHTSRAATTSRAWIVDCNLQGGFHAAGPLGPSMVAASTGQARVRIHRTQISGLAIGNIATGPVLGLHTPQDMTIGSTFVTTMRGEPGHLLELYVGTDISGPFSLPLLEQVPLGFQQLVFLPPVVADWQGNSDVPFSAPNNPALRHTVLFWRGLDLSTYPVQAPPVFVTVMQ